MGACGLQAEALRAQLEPPKAPSPPKVERTVEAPEPSDVVRASYDEHQAPTEGALGRPLDRGDQPDQRQGIQAALSWSKIFLLG